MKTTHAVLGVISILALSACQGMPWQSAQRETAAPSTPDMSSYFAQRLQDGRRHLAAYRLAAAIDAFRQASYHPDFAGDAYNGLAISYDRLGRYDLAERYFRQAMTAAPENGRFARNAARFDTAQLARAGDVASEQLAAGPATPGVMPSLNDDLRLEELAREIDAQLGSAAPQRMQRVSSREVAISSRDDWNARTNAAPPARPAVVHVGPAPIGSPRQAPADMVGANERFPVRVALTGAAERREGPAAQSRFLAARGNASIRVSGTLRPHERLDYPVTVPLRSSS